MRILSPAKQTIEHESFATGVIMRLIGRRIMLRDWQHADLEPLNLG